MAAGGGIDDGFVADAEDGLVLGLDVIRDGLDVVELSVEVFQLIEHLGAPQAGFFEVLDEVGVEDDEVAGEVALDVEVLVVRLDAGRSAHDVADGSCRRDGEHVGVAHALAGDFFADVGPVHFATTWGVDFHAALLFEQVDGVLRQQAAIPLGALVGGVGAALACEVGGSTIGIVGDGFHEFVVELDGCGCAEGETFFVEGILQTHNAEADGAVAGVRGLGSLGGVEVDIDDAIERTDGHGDGFLEHVVIDDAVLADVGIEDDGAEVADGGFILAGVEGDLGAEVGGVDDAAMVLGRADVAGVLEGDPWVTGLEDHLEHGFPEVDGGELTRPDFASGGEGLVFGVALLEGAAVEVVEIGHFIGAEKGPVLARFHAFHEQVRDPVGGVHVVGTTALVSGIDAEVEEVLDVVVPGLEVGAAGAAALAALVDGDELVVVKLEEGDDALGLAVGALDVTAGAADCGPRSTEAAGPFREVGIFGNAALHDGLDGVIDLVEVAGGKLAVEGAGIEQGGCGRAEAAAFVEIVEADDPLLAVLGLGLEEAHGDAHPEELGRLEATLLGASLVDDEVAVIHGLDAEVVEVEVGAGVEGIGKGVDVELGEQIGMDALDADAVGEVALEGIAVGGFDAINAIAGDVPIEHFLVDVGEQDAAGEFREVGIFFDQSAGIENDGLLEVVGGNFRSDRAAEFAFDLIFREAEVEAYGGKGDAFFEVEPIPEGGLTIVAEDDDHGILVRVLGSFFMIDAVASALEAIAHVGAHGFDVIEAAEFFFDHVLDVLDVDKSLFADADALGDGLGDIVGGIGGLTDGEECLADSDFDFGFGPGDDVAIAADEADGHGLRSSVDIDVAAAFVGATEGERFRDIVGIVLDEGALNEQVEVVF